MATSSPFSNPSSAGDHGHALYVSAAKKGPTAPSLTPPKAAKPKLKLPAKKAVLKKIPPKKTALKKQPSRQSSVAEEQLMASLAQALPPPNQGR